MVIVTYHPSGVMQDRQRLSRTYLSDLRKMAGILSGGPAEPLPQVIVAKTVADVARIPAGEVAYDIETDRRGNDITCCGVGNGDEVVVVPFDDISLIQALRAWFGRHFDRKYAHNAAFDLPRLRARAFVVRNTWDTMVAGHVLDPDESVSLTSMLRRYGDVWAWKHMNEDNTFYYNGLDVAYTFRLAQRVRAMLAERGQLAFVDEQEMPRLERFIIPLSAKGLRMDNARREKLYGDLKAKIAGWKGEFTAHCESRGYVVPFGKKAVSSPKLATLLYDTLSLPLPPSNKRETNKYALRALASKDMTGTVTLLLQNSQLKKDLVHLGVEPASDGRVRCRIVFGGDDKFEETRKTKGTKSGFAVASGRLSARDPNLMNVPKSCRVIYVASKGLRLVEADYSAIELRLVHWFSQDKKLGKIFTSGIDGHIFMAWNVDRLTKLYGLPDTIEETMVRFKAEDARVLFARDQVKRITYGWAYRMGAKTMYNIHQVPVKDAGRALAALNEIFPGVVRWWDRLMDEVGDKGYLENPFGRRRYFPLIDAPKVSNFLPQSTAADILFHAMDRVIALSKVDLLLPIHDALLCEGPDAAILSQAIKGAMEFPIAQMDGLIIPATIKTGPSWGELK